MSHVLENAGIFSSEISQATDGIRAIAAVLLEPGRDKQSHGLHSAIAALAARIEDMRGCLECELDTVDSVLLLPENAKVLKALSA